MQAVLTSYLVVSALPIVIEDEVGQSLSYSPGAIFQALSNNPSVVRLLDLGQIILAQGAIDPTTGFLVIQGPIGPTGPSSTTVVGWEDVGTLVRLVDIDDQVSAGDAAPPASSKFTIDASSGSYTTGLLVVNGFISFPGSGGSSERLGLNATAGGANATALGESANASATSATAGGQGSAATGSFGSAWGATAAAGADSTALGGASTATNSGTAVGRTSTSSGLRSFAGGFTANNTGQDSTLLGSNGTISADEVVVVGASATGTAPGALAAGFSADATATDASAWGRNSTSAFASSHAFGAGSQTTAANQFVAGSDTNPIAEFHLGKGEAAITAQDIVISSSRISLTQSNEAGSNLDFIAGPGTGAGAASVISFLTGPSGVSGNAQHVLATQMVIGVGVDVTNWLNVGSTAVADAVGEIAASDGTGLFHWDPAAFQVNIGAEGTIARVRGVDAVSVGVDGADVYVVGGTGLTTGDGGGSRLEGGASGASGNGGLAGVFGGTGVVVGGAVDIIGGTSPAGTGGLTTLRGGAGAPAGNLIASGGITNGVGGQSGTGTFSGGDASGSLVSLAGDGILKGGDGVSNNNHGANAYVRGGLADGAGTHGFVQIDTAGTGRWQVDNAGRFLAIADTAFDMGAVASGRMRDLYVGRNARIEGDLTVNGTTTTVNSEIQTADNYILLNSEYTADAAQTGGFVINIDPAATSFSISGIATNVITVAAGDPSAVLSAGDFLLIQDPNLPGNSGIREVLSATASSVTVTATPVEDFSGGALTDDATAQGTVVGVQVAALRSTTAGAFQAATGTAAPLTWDPLVVGVVESDQVVVDYDTSGLLVGDCVRVTGTTTVGLTDADADATANFVGTVKTVGTLGTGKVVTDGRAPIRFVASLTPTAGEAVFLSETTGGSTDGLATTVEPTTVGAVSYMIGYIRDVGSYGGTEGDTMDVQLRYGGRTVIGA